MIVKFAKRHGGQRCWYDRSKKFRRYHVFGLCRLVNKEGSYWRLVIGPAVLAWGFKGRGSNSISTTPPKKEQRC